MADRSFFVWMMLGMGTVIIGVIFAPGTVWQWLLRQVAREEGKSVEQFKRENRLGDEQDLIGNPSKGSGFIKGGS
jgi:hypothetical protein